MVGLPFLEKGLGLGLGLGLGIGLLRVAVTQLHVRDLSIHWHYVTDGGFAIFGESRKRVVHDGLEIIRHAIINNFSSPFPFGESVFET